ncbi:MAG: ABC transporter ATP-binding protein [Oscillospiraceae bacterium]|jgi:ABC-2 type transport system ATP-binding protein|nr:ABC transporter ATP-binding protein [Oscillospiraceae bacterium]
MAFSETNALELSGVCKAYGDFRLEQVSFTLPSGSIMGFIGENGAGKTTTLKAILNLIHLDSGSIRILGKDSVREGEAVRAEVGVVFDELPLYRAMKARDLSPILGNIYPHWDTALYEEYLRRFSLPRDKRIEKYSRGMKMKLGMAAALSHHPRLLLLDEATGGLDPVMRNELLDLLLEFIQDEGHSVLFSTHITSDLERVADYITYIRQGRILLSESKDALLERHGLIQCSRAQLSQLEPGEILGKRESAFGCQILTGDRSAAARKHPDMTIDPVSLEDLMVFCGQG